MVSRLRPGIEDLAGEALTRAEWALITGAAHLLAARSSVSLRELSSQRWVLPAGGSAFRRQMETVFDATGVAWPAAGVSSNSIPAIKPIVMAGECLTLMSTQLVDVECQAGCLRVVPVADAAPLQPLGMVRRAGEELAPIARRFVAIPRDAAARAQRCDEVL